jgi:hypothetical protein
MSIVFYILVGASVLIGLFLLGYGIYGLIKKETYLIDQRLGGTHKAYGV